MSIHNSVSLIVFVKQKTADEMRISDWSSDVCSSDLAVRPWENRTVIAGEALDIKGRHLLAQDIGYVRRTLIDQFGRTDDIDRGRGLGSGQIIAARAGHDDLFIPI